MDQNAQPPGALGGSADRAACETDGTASISPDDDRRKGFERLRALAALAGIQVYALDAGRYLVCRWNLSREVPDLDVLRRFLRQQGVDA